MTTKKLADAEKRLVLALDAGAPAATIDLLRRRVTEAGGDPNTVISESQGDVTRPSNPLPTPLTQKDMAIVAMLGELNRRQQAVDELRAEQKQVQADLEEIDAELDAAEHELRTFVERESRRGHANSEPLDAA
ncbi:Uncharacterised protein [Mycobacteroides abscessus subsp. massiliense]|uniref:hypothetical protein n=1 Tax=Mycobacteroides abscessus TaxID=36809 RepID=UPI0009A8FDDE|nr:hypothetical protein [Mycobacteroides abscessus]MDO3055616.1 hypothetical protein [Mycobacteroides abscessus subsp. massiliense]SLC37694.1 Uncharacterised protein [Mycobacteroides abscessus subsp. massiliense]SLH10578.1 Uncharacterised protein [Mycobacteroides abscessus subsp. massiliense]SLI03341.1 Uncharacterised protein [Mycobacteroides abscessus subsp. massiliense]